MNERIKELAEQAGWTGLYTTFNEPTGNSNWKMVKESLTVPVTMEQIERFVELVRADERNACAKLVEADGLARGDEGLVLIKAAGRIRARGER